MVTPSATFVAGIPNAFKVVMTGSADGINFDSRGLSWLSFQNGTLSGTPPAGTSGAFTVNFDPYEKPIDQFQFNNSSPYNFGVLPFTLTVDGQPLFVSSESPGE